MKKILFALLFLFAGSRALLAIEDTPENRAKQADRYIAVSSPKDLMADVAEQVSKSAPPEQAQQIRELLTKDVDMDKLTKAMRSAMIKNFTADELSALADFYGSPVGKSAMKKIGVYMADVMPVVQGELMRAMQKMEEAPAAK